MKVAGAPLQALSPLGPGFFPTSRADFRAGVSPENPLALVSQPLAQGIQFFPLAAAEGDPANPPHERVTQMDMLIVTWEESGPTVIHPGPCGTTGLGWWQQSRSQRKKIDGTFSML